MAHPSRRVFSLGLAACAAAVLHPSRVHAQAPAQLPAWPTKAVRYIVPFAAGGLTDVMARVMAQRLAEPLGQPVIVENRPGANANIGAELVARAAPDGHTWLAVTLAHAVNQSLFPGLPYSLEKQLAPVAHLATSPLALVVPAGAQATSLAQFLELARARRLSAGSSGNGTPPHLGLELLAGSTGIAVTHVPYKGGAPSLNDLMGGQIDFIVSNLPECVGFVKAGRLRALAVTSQQRHALLPEVPTFAELGLAGMAFENWTGLMVPAGTPQAIVERVGADAVRLVRSPEVAGRVAALGFTTTGLGPAEFGAIVRQDVARWREVIAARGIRPDA